MFEMIIAVCALVVPFFGIFINGMRYEKDRKDRAIAHENWANMNRAGLEKFGVYI